MIDGRKLQAAVGAAVDGIVGRGTFTKLFRKLGASQERAEELALAAAALFPQFGIMDNALRLSNFMAQLQHESGHFKYMEEIWGPTPAQRGYEGRDDLGNDQPGDGFRYKGRGPIQLTGRANYRHYGRLIGIDLERHPELAAIPSIGLRLALEYWKAKGLNVLADSNDVDTITRRINGGTNGLADRKANLAKLRSWLL
jgi:putative chitinase